MKKFKYEHSYISPRNVRALRFKTDAQRRDICKNLRALKKIGVGIDSHSVRKMVSADADPIAPLSTPSLTTPIQFLQTWLPGFVEDVTAARKIDTLTGISMQGEWHDEEVVQGFLERQGTPRPYTDEGNSARATWNTNFERRTVVRWEMALEVGRLEEARAGMILVNSADAKRTAIARGFEIERNRIGFQGFNDGDNRTWGVLNDPHLPAYRTLPNGAGGTSLWATKNFDEIKNDLLTAAAQLRVQSQDLIDPTDTEITLAVAMSSRDFLAQATSANGVSVLEWLSNAYPTWRVVSVPEFDGANGGANVFYLYAESLTDSGTDDTRTWVQPVQTKMQILGVEQNTKSFEEAYASATAGVILKRPYSVVRFSGV